MFFCEKSFKQNFWSPGRPGKSKSGQFWVKRQKKFFLAPKPIYSPNHIFKDFNSGSLKKMTKVSGRKKNHDQV